MKFKMILVALGVAIGSPYGYAQSSAEILFDTKCASCHAKTRPNDTNTLVAPPMMGVMRHVKMKYDSKEKAVDFMVAYALNPQKSKAVCMPEKLERFGLMPSQKGNVTKAELQTIAAWAYDNFGGQGHGKGHGKSCKNK